MAEFCNIKIAKTSDESDVEHLPPSGMGFSFDCCHPPLSYQADRFQMLIDPGSSKHFDDSKLIRGVESRMLEYKNKSNDGN